MLAREPDTAATAVPFDVFLHIPKTAGTTLGRLLDAQYGHDRVVTFYHQSTPFLLDNLGAYVRDPRHDFGALIGHFGFRAFSDLGRPVRTITFMREPVRRTVSDFLERVSSQPETMPGPDGPVTDLAQALAVYPSLFRDEQTRYLSGAWPRVDPTDEDLERARRHLAQSIDFVGLVERFDESVLLLTKLLGWRPLAFGTHNASGSYAMPTGETLERLRDLNAKDVILHADAVRCFDDQIAAAGPLFAPALDAFRQFLASSGPFDAAAYPALAEFLATAPPPD